MHKSEIATLLSLLLGGKAFAHMVGGEFLQSWSLIYRSEEVKTLPLFASAETDT